MGNKVVEYPIEKAIAQVVFVKAEDVEWVEGELGGLSNNIFASTYTYYIPNKEQLIHEVEKVLKEN